MMTAAVESPSTSKAGASVVPAPLAAVGRWLTAADHVRVGASLALIPLHDMGVIYTASAVVLGVAFAALTFGLGRAPTAKAAMRVFSFSISYITLLFLAVMLDVLVR
ncbi:MAG: hypothetical protein ACKO8P_09170 [Actinomycetota bacterium]